MHKVSVKKGIMHYVFILPEAGVSLGSYIFARCLDLLLEKHVKYSVKFEFGSVR